MGIILKKLCKSIKAVLSDSNGNEADINNGALSTTTRFDDSPSIDAFARLRTSDPFTIFDSKQLHDKQPLFWDEAIGGSATSTHIPADANVLMTVTENSADYVIRQTKQRFNYQPGKSQLFFMTTQAPHVTGLVNRIGCFDGTGTNNLTPNNGVFFECDTTVSWNICKNGTTTETVTQDNWNIDKLDGTGASGITLNLDAAQILVFDWEWLGVGRVRVGFVINGLVHYCHYFNHSNDSNFPTVYMSTPNLPLRYSIETDGTVGGSLRHICSSVISEGGIEKTGILRVVDTDFTGVAGLSQDTTYPILGIKLKSAYNDVTVLPEFVSMINEANDDFRWTLQLNPTLSASLTYADVPNSAVQEAMGDGTITVTTEGLKVGGGYASIDTLSANAQLETALKLGETIAGVQDELVLCCTPLSNGAIIQASINFRELL